MNKIHPKDKYAAFPRKLKTKMSKPKIVEGEKAVIQPAVDRYLAALKLIKRFEVIRIEDQTYAALKYHPSLPEWVKKKTIAALRSIPDNIIIKPNPDGTNECLCLELKTEGKDLTQGQKKFAKNVNVKVAKSVRAAKEEINKFLGIVA